MHTLAHSCVHSVCAAWACIAWVLSTRPLREQHPCERRCFCNFWTQLQASDRCKPGRQGSPPPASTSGVAGWRGPTRRAGRQPKDVTAQPQQAASSLWASPERLL